MHKLMQWMIVKALCPQKEGEVMIIVEADVFIVLPGDRRQGDQVQR